MLTTVTSATAGCCQETVEEMKEERESRKWQERMQRKPSTEEKPWRKPGADITDYFNYGFTEETWEAFYLKQKEMRSSRREMASVCKRIEDKRRANREERAGGTYKVDRRRQHQKEWSRPCSASDSHSLFPRLCDSASSSSQDDWSRRRHDSNRSSNRDRWSGGGRKSSSSVEDRATHLFTSSDSMCPSDPYFQRSPKTLCATTDRREGRVRSRDSEECREQQYEERKRSGTLKEDKPSCRTATPQREQDKDRVRSHRRPRGRRGGKREKERKRKRQDKETPPA